jgi:hypothetical protein
MNSTKETPAANLDSQAGGNNKPFVVAIPLKKATPIKNLNVPEVGLNQSCL